MDEEHIVNPIDRNADPDEKIRQLQRLTAENKPLVEKFLRQVDSKYGTQSKPSEKTPEAIKEKAQRASIKKDKPWHDIEHIRDSFRFKSVLNDLNDLPKVAQDLKDSGVSVIKVDTEKVLAPGAFGWRIAAFDLQMPNGQLVEYYCPVKEMEEAKKAGNHDIWEKRRKEVYTQLSPQEKKEYRADRKISRDRYEAGWQGYLDRTRQSPEQIREILDQTREILERQREPDREQKKPLSKLDRLFGKRKTREQEKRERLEPDKEREDDWER